MNEADINLIPRQGGDLIVIYNSLYGGSTRHATLGSGSPLDDRENPGTFNVGSFGAYRLNTRASLFTAWDNSIPVEDKAAWRDPAIASAYADAALASDETSESREPPSFRSPSGTLADSFELALDRRQWSAANLKMPPLVIRSGRNFWSRPEDARTLVAEAPHAEFVEIPDAGGCARSRSRRSTSHATACLAGPARFLKSALFSMTNDMACPILRVTNAAVWAKTDHESVCRLTQNWHASSPFVRDAPFSVYSG